MSAAAVLITSGNISATGVTVAVGIGDNASSTSVFLDNSGSIYAHRDQATRTCCRRVDLNASGNLNVCNYGAIAAVGNTAYGVYLNSTTGASDLEPRRATSRPRRVPAWPSGPSSAATAP